MYMQGTQEVNGGYRHDWRNKGGIAMVLWREYIYKQENKMYVVGQVMNVCYHYKRVEENFRTIIEEEICNKEGLLTNDGLRGWMYQGRYFKIYEVIYERKCKHQIREEGGHVTQFSKQNFIDNTYKKQHQSTIATQQKAMIIRQREIQTHV